MVKNIILAERTFDGFEYDSFFDAHTYTFHPADGVFFTLKPNVSYTIYWDGEPYICTAINADTETGILAMGKISIQGLTGGNDDAPFAIGWHENGCTLASLDDKPSHSICIHLTEKNTVFVEETLEFAEEEEGSGIYHATAIADTPLVVGKTYRIVWNGTEHVYTTFDENGVVVLGSYTYEPFAIGIVPKEISGFDDDGIMFVTASNNPTNTVAIYLVDDEPASETLLEEQDLSFGFIESLGCYAHSKIPAPFKLEPHREYNIIWDEETYTRTAFDFVNVIDGSVCVFVGNPLAAGKTANDDEFVIVYDVTNDYLWFVSLKTTDTHKVGVYQIIEEEPSEPAESEGIVLKDRNGKDVAYYGIETVTFDTTTEGKQQVYTKGVAVEGLEIVPDFSKGDMAVVAPKNTLAKSANIRKPADLKPENVREGVKLAGVTGTLPKFDILENLPIALDFSVGDHQSIVAPEGTAVKSAVIQKPADLKPENIAEGIDIAGIIGTFAGGGKIACGTFTGTRGVEQKISHNLGLIPDCVIIAPVMYKAPVANDIVMIYVFSTKFAEKIGATYKQYFFQYTGSTYSGSSGMNGYEAVKGSNIYTPTTTDFTLGLNFTEGRVFFWVAFGDPT